MEITPLGLDAVPSSVQTKVMINLIELAPKGTGKSYVFEKISKRGWLISGGTVSRASLIYDNTKKAGGLLTRFDYVGFDEVQSIAFEHPGQHTSSHARNLPTRNKSVESI